MKALKLYPLLLLLPLMGSAQSNTVEIQDNFFDPETLRIDLNETATWEHMGSVTHTATSGNSCSNPDGEWDSGDMNNGDSFSHTFNSTGTFDYYCKPHCASGMTGVVIVDDPTSIQERTSRDFELKLYPTPFDARLNLSIEGERSGMERIEVLDMAGRTLESIAPSALEGEGVNIDASGWEPGIYFVRIAHEEGRSTVRKLLKQ